MSDHMAVQARTPNLLAVARSDVDDFRAIGRVNESNVDRFVNRIDAPESFHL